MGDYHHYFLFEGVMPGLTSHTDLAREGIQHLGYPDYFRIIIVVFKVLGALVLMIPVFPPRVKEWAYVGFGIHLSCFFESLGGGWIWSASHLSGFSLMRKFQHLIKLCSSFQ
ncbi:MAG: DoxX family protein [Marinoscillum sp.]